jgi:hypothetical protein
MAHPIIAATAASATPDAKVTTVPAQLGPKRLPPSP